MASDGRKQHSTRRDLIGHSLGHGIGWSCCEINKTLDELKPVNIPLHNRSSPFQPSWIKLPHRVPYKKEDKMVSREIIPFFRSQLPLPNSPNRTNFNCLRSVETVFFDLNTQLKNYSSGNGFTDLRIAWTWIHSLRSYTVSILQDLR